MSNPLICERGLPDMAAVQPGDVAPALDVLLARAEQALEHAVSDEVADDDHAISAVLDVAVERLQVSWGTVGHLNEVADTPALRAAYNEALPRVTDFFTRLGADERLFAKFRRIAPEPLPPARRQALAHALRDFVLGGAQLEGAARARFAQIEERCAELGQAFSEHVLDATDAFSALVNDAELDGMALDVKQAAAQRAQAAGQAGYLLNLHEPCYIPVMRTASNRALRERLHRAYTTRASELGPAQWDNSALMAEMLALRHEQAQLLGYSDYAALSLAPKMAGTPAKANTFLEDLAQRARPRAVAELAELRAFAAAELNLPDVQAWDLPYAAEQLKQARYAFNSEEVKQYFTLPRVLAGLFELIETLFDVQLVPDPAPAWHPSVSRHAVRRAGSVLGHVYLDLHARAGKRSGAWMDDAQQRWQRPAGGGLQLPVAHLVCNFAQGLGEQPALLSHDDVVTLFHEFGHGLQHLLTQVDELAVSGIAGVEWDAVELPSQFMENFCWEWPVLQRLTAHVHTGAPLPRELFDKMLAAKNFHSALGLLRQVERALVDLALHSAPAATQSIAAIDAAVRQRIGVAPVAPFNRFLHGFSHIFDGGYAAGYYSYAWAEVLSADAFAAFTAAGVLHAPTGARFRQAILETGGSRSAMASFMAFKGREPSIDALLASSGLA